MLKLQKFLHSSFARSRIRSQILFQPKLKDFTAHHDITIQQQQLRSQYQQIPSQTFTNILNTPNPKTTTRFHIPKKHLNKQIRTLYKKNISLDNLQAQDSKQFEFLLQSKSSLLNQDQQIQFQNKFKQDLFRRKQILKLLKIKQKNINNYLPKKNKDQQYLKYLENKNVLHNKKIKNMMMINKNNQQLQLLIQSGLTNNPQNLKIIIQQLTNTHQQQLTLSHLSNQHNNHNNNQLTNTEQIQHQSLPSLDALGPNQLKSPTKIIQFIKNYRQQHTNDQQQCLQDTKLLKQIRQYQQQLFLSHYSSINFRFKGRVTFSFFHQYQLINYINNQSIPPKDLLLIFKQNRYQLNKFNTPIITPPVISAIYSKTSLYHFPQNQSNSRIYMLHDPNFQNLQRQLFHLITKLSDTDFCSVISAYSTNHQYQQGILNKKLSNKINQLIYNQLHFRIYHLNEKDLGLLLRALTKIYINQNNQYLHEIINFLNNKLPLLNNTYTMQSIFQYLLCLPFTTCIQQIISQHIKLYSLYKWQQNNTILSFCHAAGLLLNQYKHLSNYQDIKNKIKSIIVNASNTFTQLLPRISINHLSHFLIIFIQTQAALTLPNTANLCKKLVIDNIRTQKQQIKQQTLINILSNFVLLDTQKYLISKSSKYLPNNTNTSASTIPTKLSIKYLTVFQPIPYNSSHYLIYHQLANLTHTQIPNLKPTTLSKILQQLSSTRYKNYPLLDEIALSIYTSIDGLEKSHLDHLLMKQTDWHITRQLIAVANSYIIQRRYTDIFRDTLQLIMTPKYYTYLIKQSINLLVRFVSGVVALHHPISIQYATKLDWILTNSLLPSIMMELLTQEEIASVAFSCTMLDKFKDVTRVFGEYDINKLANPTCKFVVAFCHIIAKIALNIDISNSDQTTLQKLQSQFYNQVHKQIQYNAACIGQPTNYPHLYTKILDTYRTISPTTQIIPKKWLIQITNTSQVTFIASYDHLQTTQYQGKQPILQLSGIWKLYQKYYKLKNWKFNIILSFLQNQ